MDDPVDGGRRSGPRHADALADVDAVDAHRHGVYDCRRAPSAWPVAGSMVIVRT
ncbi:MAG: hypothetical protein ABL886_08555 [Rhodoglobus sp.]